MNLTEQRAEELAAMVLGIVKELPEPITAKVLAHEISQRIIHVEEAKYCVLVLGLLFSDQTTK